MFYKVMLLIYIVPCLRRFTIRFVIAAAFIFVAAFIIRDIGQLHSLEAELHRFEAELHRLGAELHRLGAELHSLGVDIRMLGADLHNL